MCYLIMPLVVALTPIEGELPEPFFGGENGKNLCIFLESINTLSHQRMVGERMLPSYAHWCGLEAYERGVTMRNYFW